MLNSMPPLVGLLIAALSLTGCAAAPSDPPCPPVVLYPQETQRAAAAELERLPRGGAIERMLADYSVMREQARACAH